MSPFGTQTSRTRRRITGTPMSTTIATTPPSMVTILLKRTQLRTRTLSITLHMPTPRLTPPIPSWLPLPLRSSSSKLSAPSRPLLSLSQLLLLLPPTLLMTPTVTITTPSTASTSRTATTATRTSSTMSMLSLAAPRATATASARCSLVITTTSISATAVTIASHTTLTRPRMTHQATT